MPEYFYSDEHRRRVRSSEAAVIAQLTEFKVMTAELSQENPAEPIEHIPIEQKGALLAQPNSNLTRNQNVTSSRNVNTAIEFVAGGVGGSVLGLLGIAAKVVYSQGVETLLQPGATELLHKTAETISHNPTESGLVVGGLGLIFGAINALRR